MVALTQTAKRAICCCALSPPRSGGGEHAPPTSSTLEQGVVAASGQSSSSATSRARSPSKAQNKLKWPTVGDLQRHQVVPRAAGHKRRSLAEAVSAIVFKHAEERTAGECGADTLKDFVHSMSMKAPTLCAAYRRVKMLTLSEHCMRCLAESSGSRQQL